MFLSNLYCGCVVVGVPCDVDDEVVLSVLVLVVIVVSIVVVVVVVVIDVILDLLLLLGRFWCSW